MSWNLLSSSCCGNIVLLADLRGQSMEFRRYGSELTGLACRMAHEREQEALTRWRQEQGITLTRRKATSKAKVTTDGYTAGQRAGDAISLERQLSSANGQLLH